MSNADIYDLENWIKTDGPPQWPSDAAPAPLIPPSAPSPPMPTCDTSLIYQAATIASSLSE